MHRPPSVTAAAWVIIALAVESIAGSLSSLVRSTLLSQLVDPRVGVSLTAQIGSFMQIAVIASAAFMLRGANWARIAYVVLTGVTLLGLIVILSRTSGLGVIAVYSTLKAAILIYVLFRPEANAYFAGTVHVLASAPENQRADA
jgi:hypothetical protein